MTWKTFHPLPHCSFSLQNWRLCLTSQVWIPKFKLSFFSDFFTNCGKVLLSVLVKAQVVFRVSGCFRLLWVLQMWCLNHGIICLKETLITPQDHILSKGIYVLLRTFHLMMVFCLVPLTVKLFAPSNTVQKGVITVEHLQVLGSQTSRAHWNMDLPHILPSFIQFAPYSHLDWCIFYIWVSDN